MKALPPTSPKDEQEFRKIEYRKSPEKPLMLDKKPLAPLVPKEMSKDIKPKTTDPQVKLFSKRKQSPNSLLNFFKSKTESELVHLESQSQVKNTPELKKRTTDSPSLP